MALSGSKSYIITRADIVEAALRKVGVFDQGESIPGSETSAAATALNLMVKEFTARGAEIWLRDEVTVFIVNGQESYSLGNAAGDDNFASTFVETTLSTDEATSATVLGITSTTGMTAADNIGIKLDDNTIHWDTIVSVDSSVQVTVTTGLASAAASGKKVYSYTSKAVRPAKIVYAFRRDKNGIDTPIDLIGEEEYRRLSDKDASGPTTQVWYHPTMTSGTLYTWPTDGGASVDQIRLIAQYYPDDFDAASNNPQFPIEWGNTLVWNLAAELAPEYGIPEREQTLLLNRAEMKLNTLLDYDVENASVVFEMSDRQ